MVDLVDSETYSGSASCAAHPASRPEKHNPAEVSSFTIFMWELQTYKIIKKTARTAANDQTNQEANRFVLNYNQPKKAAN